MAGVWLGLLLCLALLATPSAFATLSQADAGKFAARVLGLEGRVSLVLAAIVLGLERLRQKRAFSPAEVAGFRWTPVLLAALLTVLCTLMAQEVVQPLMALARQEPSQVALTFGQLHLVSVGLFGLKMMSVGVVAWASSFHGTG